MLIGWARAVALAIVAGACTPAPRVQAPWDPRKSEHPAKPAAEPAAKEPTPTENAHRMHTWFVELEGLRDDIIADDREGLASGARALIGGLDLPGEVPEPWERFAGELRGPVERLTDPKLPLAEAAAELASATATCGGCHESTGVVRNVASHLPDEGPLPRGTSEREVMHQHRWASARMWEGLVTPSIDRWIEGTKAFILVPGCRNETPGSSPPEPHSCAHARKLARRGHTVETWSARTVLYGELLATCAGCHVGAATARSRELDAHR